MTHTPYIIYQELAEPVLVEVSGPGDADELTVFSQFTEVPRGVGPVIIQGEFAYGSPGVLSDLCWFSPLSEPTIKPIRFEYPQPVLVEDFEAPSGDATALTTFIQMSEPPRREGFIQVGDFAFIHTVITDISWLRPFEQPLQVRQTRPSGLIAFVEDFEAPTPETVTLDKWYQQFKDVLRNGPTVIQGEFSYGAPPTLVDLRWLQALSEPGRVVARFEYPQPTEVLLVEAAEVITVDKWYQDLSIPVVRRLVSVMPDWINTARVEPPAPSAPGRRYTGMLPNLGRLKSK